jgi:hypothetical protein
MGVFGMPIRDADGLFGQNQTLNFGTQNSNITLLATKRIIRDLKIWDGEF